MKNLLYISPYIPIGIGTLLSFALLSTPAQIDSFTIVLGDFHDMNVAIGCLHAECMDIEINDDEKAVLQNIETQWMNDRTRIREKVYDQLQKNNRFHTTIGITGKVTTHVDSLMLIPITCLPRPLQKV